MIEVKIKIKIKKLVSEALIPTYSTEGDAAMDLTAVSKIVDTFGNRVYGTGLALEIPKGYVGLIFPRSSVSKYNLGLTNCVGVIDSGYRGEIMCKFKRLSENTFHNNTNDYDVGDRVAQIMIIPIPEISFIEDTDLSASERGEGGYGSTGK
tara:strand:+ start:7073 stop:7525 length:453 start_codon:yes stop_codon:yes gene_type:complete